jgi:hypothetical protein
MQKIQFLENEVYNCFTLCKALDQVNPKAFVEEGPHNFSCLSYTNHEDKDGRFIIAVSEETKKIYLAIKGTVNIENWKENLNICPCMEGHGVVHSGWYLRSKNVPIRYIIKYCETFDYQPIITGHSLGGAVAQLICTNLLIESNRIVQLRKTACVTFGAPASMGVKYSNSMNSQYNDHFLNIIKDSDPVPRILTWLHEMIVELVDMFNRKQSKIESAMRSVLDVLGKFEKISHLLSVGLKLKSTIQSAVEGVLKIAADVLNYVPVGNHYVIYTGTSELRSEMKKPNKVYLSKKEGYEFRIIDIPEHGLETYDRDLSKILQELSPDKQKSKIKFLNYLPNITKIEFEHLAEGGKIRVYGTDIYLFKVINIYGVKINVRNIYGETIEERISGKDYSTIRKEIRDRSVISCTAFTFLDNIERSYSNIDQSMGKTNRIDIIEHSELFQMAFHMYIFSSNVDLKEDFRGFIKELFSCIPLQYGVYFEDLNNKITDEALNLLNSDTKKSRSERIKKIKDMSFDSRNFVTTSLSSPMWSL